MESKFGSDCNDVLAAAVISGTRLSSHAHIYDISQHPTRAVQTVDSTKLPYV